MQKSMLSRIIYTKGKILCAYCHKHEVKWQREQVIKGVRYTYYLCRYHRNMTVKGFKKAEGKNGRLD